MGEMGHRLLTAAAAGDVAVKNKNGDRLADRRRENFNCG